MKVQHMTYRTFEFQLVKLSPQTLRHGKSTFLSENLGPFLFQEFLSRVKAACL